MQNIRKLCNKKQQMHTFQINVLIQFLFHVSNIMCSSSGRPFVHAAFYGMFFIHLCKQSSRWMCSFLPPARLLT